MSVLLVDFGGHQFFATKELIDKIVGTIAISKAGSLAYRTFYPIQSITPNYARVPTDSNPLGIGLLGARMLSFVNLVSSEM